jgi:hypothetical protein
LKKCKQAGKRIKPACLLAMPTTQSNGTKPQHKAFRRPILEILEDLKKPVDKRFIKTKVLKGNQIHYISWYTLTRLLDYHAPGWDWKITTSFDGSRVCVMGELTVKAFEGDFTRSATGNEFSEVEHFGDTYSNAEAMAFRRACARFGLGLALWEK